MLHNYVQLHVLIHSRETVLARNRVTRGVALVIWSSRLDLAVFDVKYVGSDHSEVGVSTAEGEGLGVCGGVVGGELSPNGILLASVKCPSVVVSSFSVLTLWGLSSGAFVLVYGSICML